MKTLRVLILFLGISLAALSSAVFLTVASADPNSQSSPKIWTHETDYYNNIQLARHGQMGDCYNSPLYPSPWTTDITPAVFSASPSGWHVLCGYVYPLTGTPVYYELTSPGSGPTSGSPTYAIWGNNQQFSETVNGKVDYYTSH